ncbi:MAG: thioredoxin domain-containing protein [Desulfovibrionaceae bacterium]|nr:thioredoxin domain-containing protein [Desulfovibrionaceae bacterium]
MLATLRKLLLLIIALSVFCPPVPSYAIDFGSKEELQRFILKTLRDHPQVLIDILRNNSEAVLDIAQEGSNQRRLHTLQKQWKKDLTEEKEVRIADRPILGNKEAKVRIAAFSDFTCYYCKASKSVIDTILKEFGDSVSFVFKSIPFEEKGASAIASQWFLAIAEQDEEKAWEFYNVMFEERDKLQAEGEKFIRKIVRDMKLNIAKIESDVRSSKKIRAILREDKEDADRLNIEGTPCFLVNNIVVRGAIPLDLFRIAVTMALKNAER